MGSNNKLLQVEVVSASIPLLLSKETLKKTEIILNMNDDKITMFGENNAYIYKWALFYSHITSRMS